MNDLSLSTDFFDQDWLVTVKDHPGYVAAITEIRVNDTVWEKKTYDPSSGGSYRLLEDENQIVFAKKDFSGRHRRHPRAEERRRDLGHRQGL